MCTTIPNQPFTECSPSTLGFIYTLDLCGNLKLEWCSPIMPSELDRIEYVITPVGGNNVSLIPADAHGNATTILSPGDFDIKMKVYKTICEQEITVFRPGCCGTNNTTTGCVTCVLTIDPNTEV